MKYTAPGIRIGGKGKREKVPKIYKKHKNIYQLVKDFVLDWDKDAIMIEQVSYELKAKPHEVKQIFHKLNLEGILSQAHRVHAHDTDRNPMFGGSDSGWHGNVYYIKAPKLLYKEKKQVEALASISSEKIKVSIQSKPLTFRIKHPTVECRIAPIYDVEVLQNMLREVIEKLEMSEFAEAQRGSWGNQNPEEKRILVRTDLREVNEKDIQKLAQEIKTFLEPFAIEFEQEQQKEES